MINKEARGNLCCKREDLSRSAGQLLAATSLHQRGSGGDFFQVRLCNRARALACAALASSNFIRNATNASSAPPNINAKSPRQLGPV
jgi:hypothetical protein